MAIATAADVATMNDHSLDSHDEQSDTVIDFDDAMSTETSGLLGLHDSEKKIPKHAMHFESFLTLKTKCSAIIIRACDAYLLILPGIMGCTVCQYAQQFYGSTKARHVEMRREQIAHFKKLVTQVYFDPHDALIYLNKVMCPFNGIVGKNFYLQCHVLLKKLIIHLERI